MGYETDLNVKELESLGVPYIENPIDYEDEGLGKPVSSNDIYNMITESIMKAIKNSKAKYKKAWTTGNAVDKFLIPINFISKKEYRGVNHTLLKSQLDGGFFDAWNNPYFLTFKQIEELKGKVKKGAEACKVVYFTKLYKINLKDHKDFASYDVKKAEKYCKDKGIDKDLIFYIPILKYYNVFNGSDIEGIDFKLKKVKVGRIVPDTETNVSAKLIVENYPKPAPKIKHGGNRAFYSGGADYVQMPLFTSFKTEADYYRTLFHELTHSTGHARRLNREIGNKFGSDKYAKEELVAEFGAIFLSAYAGIVWFNNDNHVAYLKSWNRRFERAKKDNKFLMRGASEAQKATDYILGIKNGSEPLFYKGLKKLQEQKENKKTNSKKKVEKSKLQKATELYKFKLKDSKPKSKEEDFKPKRGKKVQEDFRKWVKHYYSVDLESALNFDFKPKVNSFNISPSKLKKVDLQNLERVKHDKSSPFKLELEDNGVDRLAVIVTQIKPVNIPKLGSPKKRKTKTKNTKKGLGFVDDFSVPLKTVSQVESVKPNSLANQLMHKQIEHHTPKFYDLQGDLGTFLGKVEIKQKESVVITLSAPQGGGKTRFCFQVMNALAENYKVGHASIEEHPESTLYWNKVHEYLSQKALGNIENPIIENHTDLENLIQNNEVIVIDSFQKVKELEGLGSFEIDKDLRKKYDGKLFVVIFQETTNGAMRGGSKSQFDADIVLRTEKFADYTQTYVYPDKNRYQNIPLDQLKYSIYFQKLI